MVEYLASNLEIEEETLATQVDWYSFGRARRETIFPIQRFMSKWISGDISTGNKGYSRNAQSATKKTSIFCTL